MRTIETTVYHYDELSDAAKAKARDWYREASQGDNHFAESVIEDADTIAGLLGIEIERRTVKTLGGKTYTEPCIYWSGFSSQGDGACYVGTYTRKAGAVDAVKAHAPLDDNLHAIAAEIDAAAQAIAGEWRAGIRQSDSRYSHAYTMQIDIEQDTDEDGDAPEIGAEHEKALLESLRAFANWIYRGLEAEYEHSNSDDEVAETIRANEYEFTANGRRSREES